METMPADVQAVYTNLEHMYEELPNLPKNKLFAVNPNEIYGVVSDTKHGREFARDFGCVVVSRTQLENGAKTFPGAGLYHDESVSLAKQIVSEQ